jgi:hypothetical protein
MTQEVLKLALESLYLISHNTTDDPRGQADKAITAIKEALREHAMREVQRLGQEIEQSSDYERGFIDGMQKQMQSSVDKAVNAMSQRTWVGLTDEETAKCFEAKVISDRLKADAKRIEAKLKERNA